MSSYFKGGGLFERTLRFCNLLEPNHMVLSLSKLGMWAMGALVVYVLVFMPGGLFELIGALGGFGFATGNYGYRRYTQYESGQYPYPPRQVDVVDDTIADRALDQLDNSGGST